MKWVCVNCNECSERVEKVAEGSDYWLCPPCYRNEFEIALGLMQAVLTPYDEPSRRVPVASQPEQNQARTLSFACTACKGTGEIELYQTGWVYPCRACSGAGASSFDGGYF